jgi:hypothetical protein
MENPFQMSVEMRRAMRGVSGNVIARSLPYAGINRIRFQG